MAIVIFLTMTIINANLYCFCLNLKKLLIKYHPFLIFSHFPTCFWYFQKFLLRGLSILKNCIVKHLLKRFFHIFVFIWKNIFNGCILLYKDIIFLLKFKNKHGSPRCSWISKTAALKCKKWSQLKLNYLSYMYLKYHHAWMHTKTCCLITMINQASEVTSEKLSDLFCSAWNLALYWKILNENIQR